MEIQRVHEISTIEIAPWRADEPCPFAALPVELIVRIFSFLKRSHLEQIYTTCRLFTYAINTPELQAVFNSVCPQFDRGIYCLKHFWSDKPIACIQTHRDLVAIGSGNLCIVTNVKRKKIAVFAQHQHPVNSLKLCGNRLVTGASDGSCILWSIKHQQCVIQYKTLSSKVLCLEILESEDYFFIGLENGNCIRRHMIKVLDKVKIKAHDLALTSILAQSGHLFTASQNQCKIWDFQLTCMRVINNEKPPLYLSLKGNELAITSASGDYKLWNIDTGLCLMRFTIDGVGEQDRLIPFEEKYQFFAGAVVCRGVDLEKKNPLWELKNPIGEHVTCVQKQEKVIAIGYSKGAYRILDFSVKHTDVLVELAELPEPDERFYAMPASVKKEIISMQIAYASKKKRGKYRLSDAIKRYLEQKKISK